MTIESNNKKERVETCVMVLASCIVLAGVWATLATPETALAKKPVGGESGGEVGQAIYVCIAFDDAAGDGIKSDGDVYCGGEKRSKISAGVGRNFNIVFDSNNSKKRTAGRTVRLDLSGGLGCAVSTKVDVSDGAGGDSDGVCDDCIDSTPDLPAARFGTLPSGQKFGYPDSVKLEILGRDLDGLLVGNTVNTNARLSFSVGGQSWILHWGPHKSAGGTTYAPGSAPVTVERLDNDTWRVKSTGLAFLYRDNNPPHSPKEYHGQFLVPFGFTAVAIDHEETIWGDEPNGIVMGDPACE